MGRIGFNCFSPPRTQTDTGEEVRKNSPSKTATDASIAHSGSAQSSTARDSSSGSTARAKLLREMAEFSAQHALAPSTATTKNVSAVSHIQIPPPILKSKDDLRPGDILLLELGPTNTTASHLLIKYGQEIPKLNLARKNQGDTNLIHCVIWTKSPANPGVESSESSSIGEHEIVEAGGGETMAVSGRNLENGTYRVFRPTDPNLGDWAAQVALTWSDEKKAIPYSTRDAGLSVIRDSSYGPQAKKEAQSYARNAFTHSPSWKDKGAFCSHFAIAVYQGAYHNIVDAKQIENGEKPESPRGMIASHARTTNPATLEDFLNKDDAFTALGTLRIE